MAFLSVLKQLGIRQNSKAEQSMLSIDESAIVNGTNAGILEGSQQATIVKNGTGDYTITMNRAGRRDMIINGIVPLTAGLSYKIQSLTSQVVRVVFDDDTVATVTDFHITLTQFFKEYDR